MKVDEQLRAAESETPITRKQAQALGLKTFKSSLPCKKCGQEFPLRYAVNSACLNCVKKKKKAEQPKEGETELPKRGFRWSKKSRRELIDAYVDSGTIEGGRQKVGVSASEYNRELARNQDFSEAIAIAKPLADRTLEEIATYYASRGNDKLLGLVLKAKHPEEYTERKIIDNTHKVKLTDEQLDRELAKHIRLIEERKGRVLSFTRGKAAPVEPAEIVDDVPRDGGVFEGQVQKAS